jgi:hypothetical protein
MYCNYTLNAPCLDLKMALFDAPHAKIEHSYSLTPDWVSLPEIQWIHSKFNGSLSVSTQLPQIKVWPCEDSPPPKKKKPFWLLLFPMTLEVEININIVSDF